MDIYTSNDYVIVKHEGKEVARHLRKDGEGQSVENSHRPAIHQEIVRKNNLYKTTDDILRISASVDQGVYLFCKNRINHDRNKSEAESITIKACRSVINAYKRSTNKRLFSEACQSILHQDPSLWNYYKLNELYEEIIKEYASKKSVMK